MFPDNSASPVFDTDAMGRKSTVSVVIPLYNHEQYIEAAIKSVLSQTIAPVEIIVIDDGSSDHSMEIVQRLCEDHPEIISWSWSNQGAHHTLNAGILRATGDFVAILNSDDIYQPERLAACLAVMQSDPSVDAVATGVSFLDAQGQCMPNPWYENALAFFKREGDVALSLFHANFLVTTSNLFIKRSIFESLGLFSPLRYTHDLEFFLRLTLAKKKLHFLDRPLINYRLHDKNTISENKNKIDIERAAVFAFFIFRKWHEDGQDGSLQTQMARYVEILGQQEIIEIVEKFLHLLDGNLSAKAMPLIVSRPTEFLNFLSLVGVDWVTPSPRNSLLGRFTAVRKSHQRRRRLEGRPSRQIEKLKSDKEWLLEQRNAWEEAARSQQEQAQTLVQALRADNAWLLEQRNAWEQTATTQQEQAQTLVQALHADNAWLLEQRNAWEHAAVTSSEELAQCQSVLTGLSRSRLFQFLVRVNLLKYMPMSGKDFKNDSR